MKTMEIQRFFEGLKTPFICEHGNALNCLKNSKDGCGYAMCCSKCACEKDAFSYVEEIEKSRYGEISPKSAEYIARLERWGRDACDVLDRCSQIVLGNEELFSQIVLSNEEMDTFRRMLILLEEWPVEK